MSDPDVPYVVRVKKDGVVLVENGPWTEDEAWGVRNHFLGVWPQNRSLPKWMWSYDDIVVDPFQPTLF